MENIEEKECKQCGYRKPLDEFRRCKNKTDGHISICTTCYTTNFKENRKIEQERMLQWKEEQRLREEAIRYQEEIEYNEDSPSRKRNRQIYPLCPMCGTPTSNSNFLYEYQGHRLDIIKVCCRKCIPRFTSLTKSEQIWRLRRAMNTTYGEYAVIYALHYDKSDTVHHIGRTKNLTRRMGEYRRNWDKPIHHYSVLEDVTPGGLSMERESRWMLHALKVGWPIDNFEIYKTGEDRLGGMRLQEKLTEAILIIEPLTAPFNIIEPLLHNFSNTLDTRIVHWIIEQTS